jgi:hypothetical protein
MPANPISSIAHVEGSGTGGTTCSFSETVAMTVSSCERTESAKNTKLVMLGASLSSPMKWTGLLRPSVVVVPAALCSKLVCPGKRNDDGGIRTIRSGRNLCAATVNRSVEGYHDPFIVMA